MSLLGKIIRPSPEAVSRIHDLQGYMAPPQRVIRNYPKAILSRVRLSSGLAPLHQPWISYDAALRMEQIMKSRPCSVLEFGSGNSTLWFAKRASTVYSVEHNPEWHMRVQKMLSNTKYPASVTHELQETEVGYSTFQTKNSELFDIILIDGIWRLSAAKAHVSKLAPKGILYLDNSDANTSSNLQNEIPELLEFLDDWRRRTNRQMEVYTDFAPTALHATQGRLYYD